MTNAALTPNYEEVYGSSPPSISELLNKIPTKTLLMAIGLLDAQAQGNKTDTQILSTLFKRVGLNVLENVFRAQVSIEKRSPASCRIFARRYIAELLDIIVNNSNELELIDTTPQIEEIILQLYFIAVNPTWLLQVKIRLISINFRSLKNVKC